MSKRQKVLLSLVLVAVFLGCGLALTDSAQAWPHGCYGYYPSWGCNYGSYYPYYGSYGHGCHSYRPSYYHGCH